MRLRSQLRLLGFATLLGALACSDGSGVPAGTSGVVVRDSAAVTIHDLTVPDLGTLPEFDFDAEPTVAIGEDPTRVDGLLHQVRGVVRDPSGNLVIADGGSNEIRRYDAAGAFVGVLGRTGSGPGEYRAARRPSIASDSTFLLLDGREIERFSPGGDPIATTRFDLAQQVEGAPGGVRLAQAVLATGTVFSMVSVISSFAERPSGMVRGQVWFSFSLAPDWEMETIGPFAGAMQERRTSGGSSEVLQGVFAPGIAFADGPENGLVAVGETDRAEISVYGGYGRLEEVWRWSHSPTPPTEAQVDAAVQRALARAPEGSRPQLEQMMRAASVPESLPVFESLTVASTGEVWVRLTDLGEGDRVRYLVLGGPENTAATIDLPREIIDHPQLHPAISETEITAVWLGPDDVQSVRVFEYRREGGGRK